MVTQQKHNPVGRVMLEVMSGIYKALKACKAYTLSPVYSRTLSLCGSTEDSLSSTTGKKRVGGVGGFFVFFFQTGYAIGNFFIYEL
jgi:Na+/melibiose symporter-like transporter